MHNAIMFPIWLSGTFQPLYAVKLIASVTISCPPSNTAPAYFKVGATGGSVPWVPGEWHEFKNIDLSTLYVRGSAPDLVSIIGGTW